MLDSLTTFAEQNEIIKMISLAPDKATKQRVQAQVERLADTLNYIWSSHPFLDPNKLCIITALGVSKGAAAQTVASKLGVSMDEVLGIGDSPADWDFMQLCGYVASIGYSQELRDYVATKNSPDHSYQASSVDDDGMLDILEHFKLL